MGKFNDLTGQVFGRLTVLSKDGYHITPSSGKKRIKWRCVCECGNEISVVGEVLTRGLQLSCGCYRKERLIEAATTHGMTDTRLYGVWSSMKSRCYNENTAPYRLYGGRGITVCDEWRNDFMAFYDWAKRNGYDESAPRGQYTIDRIDTDGNYCPENCRLITQREQMNNVRYNVHLEHNGETHTIAEWGRITGIPPEKIRSRIAKLGWDVDRALTT